MDCLLDPYLQVAQRIFDQPKQEMHHRDVPHGLKPTLVERATRVARLPGDHSQVGCLPPLFAPYHYFENDSSPLTRGYTTPLSMLGPKLTYPHSRREYVADDPM